MSTNVLILCTHNSARSVLSEGMLNHLAQQYGKDIKAFSAGSAPSGRVNPYALQALANVGNLLRAIPEKHYDVVLLFNGPAVTLLQSDACAPYREEIWQLQQARVSFKVCRNRTAISREDVPQTISFMYPALRYSWRDQRLPRRSIHSYRVRNIGELRVDAP